MCGKVFEIACSYQYDRGMPYFYATSLLILLSMWSLLIWWELWWWVNLLIWGSYLVACRLTRVSIFWTLCMITMAIMGAGWTEYVMHDFQYRQDVVIALRWGEYSRVEVTWKIGRLMKQDEKYSVYKLLVSSLWRYDVCWDEDDWSSVWEKYIPQKTPSCNDYMLQWKIPKNLTPHEWDVIQFSSSIYVPQKGDLAHKYWRLQWVLWSVSANTWQVHSVGDDAIVSSFVQKLSDRMYDVYPYDNAQFLAGILLWERRSIDETTKDWFIRSGLMHIIAVSGFNVTIVLGFMWVVLRPIPIWIRAPVTIWAIILFVMMVGFQVPVVRAAIMGSITYLLLVFWAQVRITSLLLMTFLGFVFYNPFSLLSDMSMWLSFGSVLWIILTEPWWKQKLEWIPEVFQMREALIMTFASMIFTLPISMATFHQFSLISPIANMLTGVMIPPAMLFWAIGLVGESIPFVGVYASYIWWLSLEYILKIVELTGTQEWSAYFFENPSYAIVTAIMCFVVTYGAWLFRTFLILRKDHEKSHEWSSNLDHRFSRDHTFTRSEVLNTV